MKIHSPYHCSTQVGATIVEMTIVLSLFLLTLIVSFELFRVAYTNMSLQFVADSFKRSYSVSPKSPSVARDALDELARQYNINIPANGIDLCPVSTPTCRGIQSTLPGDFVSLTIRCPVSSLVFGSTPNSLTQKVFNLQTTIFWRNEP